MDADTKSPPANGAPTAFHATACSACEARVYDWLKAHTEAWYGPQKKWTKRQQDKFYVELSLLTLFTKGFRFTEQHDLAQTRRAGD